MILAAEAIAVELPWTHVTPDHPRIPLPSSSVQTVMQDREATIWLGFFSSGLVRYDGQGLEPYDIEDGLADSTVRQTIQDVDGYLWVGSESGVVISERPLPSYPPGTRIRFVAEVRGTALVRTRIRHNWMAADPAGGVWVATAGRGLMHYRIGTDGALAERTFSLDFGGGVQEVPSALTVRRDGSLWLATEGRTLAVLPPGGARLQPLPSVGPAVGVITALYEGRERMWGGCRDGVVFRVEGGRPVALPVSVTERISTVLETRAGEVWFGSLGSGLLRFDPRSGSGERFGRREGLTSESVWEMLEDREGNLWVAHNAGVSRLRPNFRAFAQLTGTSRAGERPVLPEPSVFTVLAPPTGARLPFLWAGTGGGLAAIAPSGESSFLGAADGLWSGTVYSLARDAGNRIWIGTLAGLNVLSFDAALPPALGSSAVRDVRVHGLAARLGAYPLGTVYEVKVMPLPAGDGGGTVESVWVTGPAGLACHADGAWFVFRTAAGLPASGSGTVALDPEGRVWVGSRDSGVLRSTEPLTVAALRRLAIGQEITRPVFAPAWGRAQGAPSDSAHNLAWAGGRMWVGTAAGLAALTGEPPRADIVLGRATGLGGDRILGMASSPATGSLWVTQNDGVAEVNPADGTVLRRVSRQEGLADNEVWVSSSLSLGADETVYLATPRGLSIYRPQRDGERPVPPLLRFGRIDFQQDAWGNNELSVSYRALSFTAEESIRFRTRLLGYDSDWSPPTKDAKIRYTNLPAFLFARRYVFEFTAGTAGQWTEPALRHAVRVRPAWYASWWAALLWTALAGGAVAAYSRRLRDDNRSLERRVEERTRALERSFQERKAERGLIEETVASSSGTLAALSRQMSAHAEETSMQAELVATTADRVNSGVQAVTVAVEQLSSSAREIAGSAAEAARIAQTGVERAAAAGATISSLGGSSEEIGEVLATITSIAKQTNMLAFNATIEAARAGEKGRGFAVVAADVKALAKQTAAATDEVRERIAAIQCDSVRAVNAIKEISGVIERINVLQESIAASIEEHTATTSEIARTVAAAASGSAEIAAGIGAVADAAKGTTEGASSSLRAADDLADLAARLRED